MSRDHRPKRPLMFLAVAGLLFAASVASADDVTFENAGLKPGDSVTGPGTVHPLLDIEHQGSGPLVLVEEGDPTYVAYVGDLSEYNGCLDPDPSVIGHGFGSPGRDDGNLTFTFAPDVRITSFSIRMLDYGDLFRDGTGDNVEHTAKLVAYDAQGNVVDEDVLTFTSSGAVRNVLRMTSFFGEPVDVALSPPAAEMGEDAVGDACGAMPGDPGNYTFVVAGRGIVRVELVFVDTDPNRWGNQSLDDAVAFDDISFTTGGALDVEIDVKPGDDNNFFNLDGHGVVPVAINGSADFDVRQVDPASLVFGGLQLAANKNGKLQYSIQDWNEDGYDDLVCLFADDPSQWIPPPDATEAPLMGMLVDGTEFEGSDSVSVKFGQTTTASASSRGRGPKK